MNILWTSSDYKGLDTAVNINHFVPLVEIPHTTLPDPIVIDGAHEPAEENSVSDNDDRSQSLNHTEADVEPSGASSSKNSPLGGFGLTTGFLSLNECLSVLIDNASQVMQHQVPSGPKNNVYFVIDNA